MLGKLDLMRTSLRNIRRKTMRRFTVFFLILALIVVACGGSNGGGGQEATPTTATGVSGDAAAGEELFHQTTIDSQPGCITCHSLEPDTVLVGPSMAGIASRAGSRVSGESAQEYIHQSILNPDAYTVEGFSAGVMPAGFADALSEQQVNDLVAYLMTLQ
jgi:sulfur-oxidizing protein SoxX